MTTGLPAHRHSFDANKRGFEVVAHRGARVVNNPDDIAPENTMPCFAEAARRGVAVELDVISTKDGRLVIHHDDKTGKIFTLPTGDKFVRNVWFSEIKDAKLNVGGHEAGVRKMLGPGKAYQMHPKHSQTKLSTLEEVVDAFPDTHFYFELKTRDKDVKSGRNNHLEERVAKVIRDKNLYDRVTVISFSRASVKKIRRIDPRIKTGLDFELPKYIKHSGMFAELFVRYLKKRIGVSSIHPSYEATTPRLVKAAHEQNMRIVPWVDQHTVDEEKSWFHTLKGMGADGLITNAVDVIQDMLNGTDTAKGLSSDIKE